MTNELIADGIYRVSGMETSLKNGAWVSDAGTYLVTDQTKLADIPEARPGDIAFTAGYGHIWQLDVDSTTWVELPKTAAGTAASQAAASATAAAGSASAAATSASQAQTVADSIPADYTSLSKSVVDLKSAFSNGEVSEQLSLIHGKINADGSIETGGNYWITDDYIPVDSLAKLYNNTTGNAYIDGYNYNNGSYTFVGYKPVAAGSNGIIPKHVTHIRIYINQNNQNVTLTKYATDYIRSNKNKAVNDAELFDPNSIGVINASIVPGYNNYGEIVEATARGVSTFIPIIPNITKVKFTPTIKGITGLGFAYYIYDENYVAIDVYDYYWTRTIPLEGVESIPARGAYIRFVFICYPDQDFTNNTLRKNFKESITISNAPYFFDMNGVKYASGYYLGNTGTIIATENAATTTLIEAKPGKNAVAVMRTKTGTVWMAGAIYDQSARFITRFVNQTYETVGDYKVLTMKLPIPSNGFIGYVRFSFGANYEDFTVTMEDRMPLPRYNVLSVNHRGYNKYAPENTIPAFKLSKAVGFDWIETDVQFTGDNTPIPVILHDRSINRTAGLPDGSETINIDSITYEQALEYDFGNWFSPVFEGTKIPTFDETIKLCKDLGLNVRIELKSETVTTVNIPVLIGIIEKYGMQRNVEFASFGHTLINYIVLNHPEYPVSYIQGTIDATLISTIETALQTTKKVSCAVSRNNTAENFALLAETGVMIDIYAVDTDAQVINADSHVSSFTTNMPNAGEVLNNAVKNI